MGDSGDFYDFDPELFAERLKEAYPHDTIKKIEEKTSVPRSSIQKYMTAQVEPRMSSFIRLAHGSGSTLDWMALLSEKRTPDEGPTHVTLPYMPDRYIGAAQRHIHEEHAEKTRGLAFTPQWIKSSLQCPVDSAFLLAMEGDLMEPTLRNHNLVFVERTPYTSLPTDGLYALYFAQKISIRRIETRADRLFVLCDNKERYGSFDVSADSIVDIDDALTDPTKYGIFGRVVYVSHRV